MLIVEIEPVGIIGFVLIVCLITFFPAAFNAILYYGGLTLAAIIGLAILYYTIRALIFVGQVSFLIFVLLPLKIYRKMTA